MRPSWPPPRSRWWRQGRAHLRRPRPDPPALATAAVCAARQPPARARPPHPAGQDGRREQRGVHRAGVPDRQRTDRHARRHLDDRQQTIQPLERVALTGTPSTGRVVLAANMPGRCAAPPAPAMMTRRPRPLRSRHNRAAAQACDGRIRSGPRAGSPARPGSPRRAQRRPVRLAPHDQTDPRRLHRSAHPPGRDPSARTATGATRDGAPRLPAPARSAPRSLRPTSRVARPPRAAKCSPTRLGFAGRASVPLAPPPLRAAVIPAGPAGIVRPRRAKARGPYSDTHLERR